MMTRRAAVATARAVEQVLFKRCTSTLRMAFFFVVLLQFVHFSTSALPAIEAFVPSSSAVANYRYSRFQRDGTPTQLAFNQWGGFGDFLNTNRTQAASTFRDDYFDEAGDEDDDESVAAGTQRLITLPVKAIKPGGLRLFLMFYLMGMQNTPDRMSWKADQPTMKIAGTKDDVYVVDMHFHDHTGVLSVELKQDKVIVERVGSSPSTQYLIQEAVLLNGILDELERCANDETIQVSNRLILLEDANVIEKARGELAFR